MAPRPSATRRAGGGSPSPSPPAPGCSPISPAGGSTEAGRHACAVGDDPGSSSSMTLGSAPSPAPRPTTSTSWWPSAEAARSSLPPTVPPPTGTGRSRACGARRGAPPLPARLRRAPKEGTVYYCPDCGTRYLGVQRCEDCDRFCRRLGAGGLCPCCDEPVALKDLVEGVTIMFSE